MKPLYCYVQLTVRVVCSICGVSPTPPWGWEVLSGKVHGAQGVLVDLDCFGQGLLVSSIALA